jgi:hypothetical protein
MMDSFQRCVQDLEAIDRLLELPNGRDIAVEMLRELSPYFLELTALREHDPTGAIGCLLDYAQGVRLRLAPLPDKFSSGVQTAMRTPTPRVA